VAGEDIELIRRAYAAWNRGDVEGLVACYRSDAEVRPSLGDLAGSVYRGHEGVRRWYADANGPWNRLLAEPKEIIEHGGVFVILVHATAHGHESGIDVDAHIVHVARIEGGLLASVAGYSSERAAAGYLAVALRGGFAWCGVEPLSPTAETPKAATHSAIVTARMRRGVSHVRCRACSHERAPVAPAAAAIAHAAHMARA
jgi:ketosteroid isomerase-like protein